MKKIKRTDPKILAEMRKEAEKDFDFSKVEKRVVTINLDNDIVEYFKSLSQKTGKGYQVLIKEALKYFVDEELSPRTVWKK